MYLPERTLTIEVSITEAYIIECLTETNLYYIMHVSPIKK